MKNVLIVAIDGMSAQGVKLQRDYDRKKAEEETVTAIAFDRLSSLSGKKFDEVIRVGELPANADKALKELHV